MDIHQSINACVFIVITIEIPTGCEATSIKPSTNGKLWLFNEKNGNISEFLVPDSPSMVSSYSINEVPKPIK
ncbi:hypothetical protein [Hanstruepera neustonica]|uniref:hypothetical protein n=1 Tax=Hanstruepera neustonica TaxID=1445657 RepID=UPI0013FE0C5B|nr:hypothetical protein [Hanstruepera neustonica]